MTIIDCKHSSSNWLSKICVSALVCISILECTFNYVRNSLIPRPLLCFMQPQSWGGASGYELGESIATGELYITIHILRFSCKENLQHCGSSYGWSKEARSRLWWANTKEWAHNLTEGMSSKDMHSDLLNAYHCEHEIAAPISWSCTPAQLTRPAWY